MQHICIYRERKKEEERYIKRGRCRENRKIVRQDEDHYVTVNIYMYSTKREFLRPFQKILLMIYGADTVKK